jgi:hypothetical protein
MIRRILARLGIPAAHLALRIALPGARARILPPGDGRGDLWFCMIDAPPRPVREGQGDTPLAAFRMAMGRLVGVRE